MKDCDCTYYEAGDTVMLNKTYYQRFTGEVMEYGVGKIGTVIEQVDAKYHIVKVDFGDDRIDDINCAWLDLALTIPTFTKEFAL